jgi:hypothetical protein
LPSIPIQQSPQRNGQVAQLVERGPEKAGVGGSIPSLATITSEPPAVAGGSTSNSFES